MASGSSAEQASKMRSDAAKDGVRRRLRLALLGAASAAAIVAGSGGIIGLGISPVDAQAASAPVTGGRESFERGYADLVGRVLPAVVAVQVEKTQQVARGQTPQDNPEMRRFFERFFGQPMPGQPMPGQPMPGQPMPGQPMPGPRAERGEGSGVIIRGDGHIVTNAHVVDGASKISVILQDGRTVPAKLVGVDEKTDLAVVKVEGQRNLPFVQWGDSSGVRVGDKVLAVGNPFGLGGTVTSGIVSATGRELGAGPYDDFLQVDAAINRGNSGGPTFNLDGQVIGINSIIFSPSGGNVGIGFAIAANLAREVTTALIDQGSVTRGWLGVGIQQVTPDIAQSLGFERAEGAIVTNVEPSGPAAKGGLKTGDVINSFNGAKIDRVRELTRAVADIAPGRSAAVVIWRDGQARTLQVEVGRMPGPQQAAAVAAEDAPADQPRLGLSLAGLTAEARRELGIGRDVSGVLVQGVQPGSPADEKGLQAGDILLRIGKEPVTAPEQAIKLVRQAHERGDRSVLVLFQRDGAQLFTAIPFAVS